jgi:hypothetical protein
VNRGPPWSLNGPKDRFRLGFGWLVMVHPIWKGVSPNQNHKCVIYASAWVSSMTIM